MMYQVGLPIWVFQKARFIKTFYKADKDDQ